MDHTQTTWILCLLSFTALLPHVRAQAGCSIPAGVANAEILTSSPYSHGDLVTFRCLSGFTMTGQPSQQCQSGSFSGSAPTCAYLSRADVHEQTVDLTDTAKDDSMMYGMGALIGVVFLVMVVLLVVVLIVICRRIECCRTRYDVERPRKVQFGTPETARSPRMAQLVDRVMADRRASNYPPAKDVSGWKPFAKPRRDINTSTQ